MSVRTLAAVAAQTALLAAVITFAPTSAAQASAGRTFVASTGNDGNTSANCALATPCRTFSGALGVTTAGGEIVALDTAGYGEVTISGPVSIIAAVSAEVTVTTGTTGITVNATAGDNVILKNLVINGGNAASTTGIAVNGGHVVVLNSDLKLLTIGLLDNGQKVDLVNCNILGNGTGVSTTGAGTDELANGGFAPLAFGPTQVRISYGTVLNNTTAYFMSDPGSDTTAGNNKITILLYNPGSPVQAGNGTLANGTGASCTAATNSKCQTIASFNDTNQSGQLAP